MDEPSKHFLTEEGFAVKLKILVEGATEDTIAVIIQGHEWWQAKRQARIKYFTSSQCTAIH